MIRVLVPIDAFSLLTLSATYFALEFAKRNPAKVYFLILEAPDEKASAMEQTSARNDQWPALFKQLLQRGREHHVHLEKHYSREDYLTAISRVAEQHNIDDIIMAVPPVMDKTHAQNQRLIELLRHQVPCHIITVKAKEVGKMLDSWGKKETIS